MLLLLASVLSVAFASCPDVSVVTPFNATKYLGSWYEIAASPLVRATFERNCVCTEATYGLNPNGTLSVLNKCRKGSFNGTLSAILGYATLGQGVEEAKLEVYFPQAPKPGNYWLVYLENNGDLYDNAIVWSCEHLLLNIEFMWILSREKAMSATKYDYLLAKAKLITGYDAPKKLIRTDQSCPDSI
jgi:apolipoprotein D and lipocalin family protein